MLVTMKEILDRASEGNYGVAAPNVDNELLVRAAIEAAEEMNAPLILDVAFMASPDVYAFGHLCRSLAEQSRIPVAINLDHGASIQQVAKCIQAGFTSVMIDRSSYPDDENIRDVAEVVKFAHACGVSVESELGHVGQASQYDIDRDAALTDPDFAAEYIEKTGVDCLAVAVGTAHGAYPEGFVPYLDFDRLVAIKKATNHFPLVLHGSSGTDDESLRKACQLGINKVNINTDLQQAAARAWETAEVKFSIFKTAQQGWKEYLKKMIGIYGSEGKAWEVKPAGLPATRIPARRR